MKFRSRHLFIGLSLLTIVGGLTWRVVNLQVTEQSFLRNQGDMRTIRVVNTQAYRGMITDRNGEPLAISTPVSSVWLNPKEFSQEHPHLLALAGALDISLDQLNEKASKNLNREFIYLKRHVSPTTENAIKQLNIPGIHLKTEYRRFYPAGEVTAHILGFTDLDEQGKEGLELAFDSALRGTMGSKRIVRDRRGREVQILEGLQEMRSGQEVMLSLDQRLQYLAYRELKAAVNDCQATAGSAVVLDVQTGEILAMVNQPSFNPNMRVKLSADGSFRNRAVTDRVEPGSLMKPLSVVSALQHGRFTPKTRVDTSPGWLTVGGRIVKEDKNRNFGLIDVASILQKSSNVGVAKLTLSLPSKNLLDTYSRMGFGSITNSGFPGEASGVLVEPPKQSSFVLATMAFGYGLSVTPLQLAQAYAILGAGGVKRPITFIKQTDIPSGEEVIDPVISRQVLDMLTSVVEEGSGRKAKVIGYKTAGKTGTARKVSSQGGYQKDSHVALFAGLAPASNPRFAIVVMIDDPKGEAYYGSQLAAPVFSKIASGALRLFNIPPDIFDRHELRVAKVEEVVSLHE